MIQTPTPSATYQSNILSGLTKTGITNTAPGAKARAFCDAVGDQLGLSESSSFSLMAQNLLPYANNSNLDYLGQIFGITRLQRLDVSTSSADNNFEFYVARGTFGSINNGQDIVIPAGTQLYTSLGLNGPIVLTSGVTLCPAGASSVYTSVVSLQAGSAGNAASGIYVTSNFTSYAAYQYGSLLVTNNYGLVGGRDAEQDEDYRYRISLWLQSHGGAAQVDLRLAALAIPGIQDVVFETQAGTYTCYVYGVSPYVPISLLQMVQSQLDQKTAYPLFGTAVQPDIIGISFSTTLTFALNTSSGTQANAIGNAQSAAANYINNLAIGQEFVINQLADIIMNSDSNIIDVGNPNQPIISIYIWRARNDGTRYSRTLIADYVPQVGERIVVETSLSNPINITSSTTNS